MLRRQRSILLDEPDCVTPGEVIRENILERSEITQEDLADAMGVSRYSVNQLVNNRRHVTPEMALRLSKATSTSVEFWLNLQRRVDLQRAERHMACSGRSRRFESSGSQYLGCTRM